ncbi:activator of Hsp90 ATPase [Syncephalis fuscata]|nr:activator of Hsp90 ATPase [Syncephalis fuscata]
MASMANWKNVNNWTEKNCYVWAKSYFTEQLPGTTVSDGSGASVKVASLLDCTGDVDVNQRKGKVITLYDLVMKLGFEGNTADGIPVKGSISIPEIMHDTEEDEFVFDITMMERHVKWIFGSIFKRLIDAHSKDVYIPPEQLGLSNTATSSVNKTSAKSTDASTAAETTTTKKPAAGHFSTTDIKVNAEFVASAHDLYDVLLTKTNDFSLFDSNITGTIVELVPDEKIVMSWRFSSWPANHLSNVAITLAQGESSTELRLTQRGVPLSQEETTRQNWQRYYWDSISRTFGHATVVIARAVAHTNGKICHYHATKTITTQFTLEEKTEQVLIV